MLVDEGYSQIELRVLPHMAGDPTMIEAFNSDMDMFIIEGRKKPLFLEVNEGELTIHYGQEENIDVYAKLKPEVMDWGPGGDHRPEL